MVTPVYVIYISTTGVRTLLRTPTRSGKRTTRRSTRSRTERGCADTLLLGAAWVLCVPPSRALGTAIIAGKALNHGTDDHQPVLLSSRALAFFTKPVGGDGPGSRRPQRAAHRARCAAAQRCLGTMCPALARLGDRDDSRESAEPRHR